MTRRVFCRQLIWLKPSPDGRETFERTDWENAMPRFAPKAIFSMLMIHRTAAKRPAWDRIALLVSIAVTIGLVALYAYGKATSRW